MTESGCVRNELRSMAVGHNMTLEDLLVEALTEAELEQALATLKRAEQARVVAKAKCPKDVKVAPDAEAFKHGNGYYVDAQVWVADSELPNSEPAVQP